MADSPRKAPQEVSDPDFVWEEYLEATKSESAPPEAFTHVEYSLQSGFKVGMKLEIPNPEDKSSYWLASVVMTCGELLTLRYVGYGDDRSGDFWFNIKSGEFHPVGWCSSNSKNLLPPKGVLAREPNVWHLLEEELKKVESNPALHLQDLHTGFMPIDQIKCGMKVEVSEDLDPESVWIATIVQNIGGRLFLRYDGLKDSSSNDFWLFYLSDRLNQVGNAPENNMKYCVPKVIKEKHSETEWQEILKKSINESENNPFPAHVLEPKLPLEEHGFTVGMKLEAVDPQNCSNICPATVSSVVNNFYFLVTIDSYTMDDTAQSIMCCNSNSQLIFPVKWAEENGLDLTPPKGYEVKGSKFLWDDYLAFCKAAAVPVELFSMCCMNTGFQDKFKLESVDPLHPNYIYVATIEKIVEPIMFLHFDIEESVDKQIIVGVNSFDIYPVGWCASNSYPLQTPVYRSKSKVASVPDEREESNKSVTTDTKVPSQTEQQGRSWCPKIFFNHRCFSGPLLSKSRLAELPQAIGPGPVHLVMNEVISRLVSIAYKSSRVLQILQVHGKPSAGMLQQVVKAKYKGKSYRATIEVIRFTEQVEDFCKDICTKLECCPYLFGPKHVEEICPSKCHTQTKTKFGYNFVKKHKKPGRPPLATTVTTVDETTGETIRRGPGRKKKRKHWTQLLAESENSQKENISKTEDSNETEAEPETVSKSETSGQENNPSAPKENAPSKKKLKHIPSSSIVTRGAKLPNFGLWHHFTSIHSRRGRPRTRPIRPSFPPRKVGRPLGSTKKAIAARKESEEDDNNSKSGTEEVSSKESKAVLKVSTLKSNPIDWSVDEVVKYIQETDCAPIAPLLKEQEIDGQALLMLNVVNVQQYLNLKPEPAEKFCYIIKNLKIEFFTHFV